MKILHLIPTMGGGGAERQLCYVAQGLVAHGHEVHIGLMLPGANTQRLKDSGACVHDFRWRRPFDPALIAIVLRLIHTVRPTVVQTWLRRMDVVGGTAARLSGIPWVYSERLQWIEGAGWREVLKQKLVDMSSAVIANSETGATHWRVRYGRRKPVLVIPNAVPVEEVRDTRAIARSSVGVPEDAELVLYAGRFASTKNIPLLTRVVTKLLKARKRTYVLACGVGPEFEGFRRAVDLEGVGDRCITPGYRDDIWAIMKAADVYLSTSSHEGQPNSVLEAMAAGCPLVVSGIRAHREFLTNAEAEIFAEDSSDEAMSAVTQLLIDRHRANTLAENAARKVQEFSVGRTAIAYERAYSVLERT